MMSRNGATRSFALAPALALILAPVPATGLPAVSASPAHERGTPLEDALERAGSNRAEIERALAETPPLQRSSMEWLVAHMPASDLATLDAAFLRTHVDTAFTAWKSAPWAAEVDDELFRDSILPYASVSETRELWMPALREKCLPLVAGAKTAGEAAVILNTRIFPEWKVQYSTKRRRADQSPSESIASGLASCTGLSILLVDACRSVGVPARFVGVPMWTDGSGNHSWVEVWDGTRWRYTGAAEPTGDRLDEGWFSTRAAAQGREKPEHAIYAVTWRKSGIEFPMVFDAARPRARAIDVTDRYRAARPTVGEGMRVVRVLVRDRASGSRIAAAVEASGADGAVLAKGRSNDETRDLNDHLELVVPASAALRFTVAGRAPVEVRKGRGDAVELVVDADARERLAKDAVEEARARLWDEYASRARTELKPEFDARVLVAEDGTKMPFWYAVYGEKPAKERSLYISMHGGGGAPKEVNDKQWENQKKLYRPDEGVYVAPRAPTDTWNLWHQGHIDPLFARLIRAMVLFEGVDPDRVYLMGYSAGGDGVFQLAPRMADYFAAASMMAGHPNETKPDGLRNLPFAIFMGGKDAAFNRNDIARQWKTTLDALSAGDPGGYPHTVTIFEENGHWMERKDAVAVPWMAKATRDLRPRRIVWLQDDVTHARFYWLMNPEPKQGQRVVARLEGQTIDIDEATGVSRLVIRLDDSMVDLDRPVTVRARGKVVFEGRLERTLDTLRATLGERGDLRGTFPAEIEVRPDGPT